MDRTKKYSFTPTGNYIVADLIEDEKEKKTQGGIYLPDQAKDKPYYAEVVAVGPGLHTDKGDSIPIPLQPGDTICINKFSYQNIELPNGDKKILFSYGDVMGVLKEETE